MRIGLQRRNFTTLENYYGGNYFIRLQGRNIQFMLSSNPQGICVCLNLIGWNDTLLDSAASQKPSLYFLPVHTKLFGVFFCLKACIPTEPAEWSHSNNEGAWFCHTRQKSLYKPLLPLLSNYHVFLNYAHLSTDIPFSTAGEGAKWAAGKLFLKSYVCSRLLLEAQRVRTE